MWLQGHAGFRCWGLGLWVRGLKQYHGLSVSEKVFGELQWQDPGICIDDFSSDLYFGDVCSGCFCAC